MTQPSSRAVDVVGLFDEDFRQVAEGARPVKAIVREEARVMDHPVEDGSTITDHRVMLPVEIELSLILPNPADDYARIRSLYRDAELLTVQTTTTTYPDMLISGMPHDESPEMFGVVPLALQLRQVITVEAQFQALPPRQVASPRNASTRNNGEKSGKPGDGEATRKSSTAYRLFGLDKPKPGGGG